MERAWASAVLCLYQQTMKRKFSPHFDQFNFFSFHNDFFQSIYATYTLRYHSYERVGVCMYSYACVCEWCVLFCQLYKFIYVNAFVQTKRVWKKYIHTCVAYAIPYTYWMLSCLPDSLFHLHLHIHSDGMDVFCTDNFLSKEKKHTVANIFLISVCRIFPEFLRF